VPAYNFLLDFLEDEIVKKMIKPSIKSTAQAAKEKIKRYYQTTDPLVYVISTSKTNYVFIVRHSYLIFIKHICIG